MTRQLQVLAVALALFIFTAAAFARGGGGCLAAGTCVLTPTGPVTIESLTPGETVYSVTSAGLTPAKVVGVYQVSPTEFVQIDLPDERIDATVEHPFQISPGTFRAAAQLHAGDTVVRWNGRHLIDCPIIAVHRIAADRPAFNLTVMPGETFVAYGVVVHNKGCFLPDTPVLKSDGSSVAISTIRAGDSVMAFDADQQLVPAKVLEIVSIEVDSYLQIATDRVMLSVTDEHPFFVGQGTFRSGDTLRVGDTVYAFDGRGLAPQIIRSIATVNKPVRVYNLRTDEPHTYFAAGIAVHNKGGGGGGHGGFGGGHYYGSGGRGGGSGPASWVDCCGFAGMAILVGTLIAFAIRQSAAGVRLSSGFELDFIHPQSTIRPKAEATESILSSLAGSDPMFEPAGLRELARDVFVRLQQCWQSQNYQPMKPLLTPGLFDQHQAQLAAMHDHHEINRIDKLVVQSVDIVHVHYSPADHRPDFTALITASARDFYVDSRTNRFLRGDTSAAQFQEFWTFGRNENRWVLRRIEQSRESNKLKEPNSVTGVSTHGPAEELTGIPAQIAIWSRSEPFWDRGAMVDRASAVFTALMLASQGNTTQLSAADFDAKLLADIATTLSQQRQQGISTELRNFDVRHVEVIAVHREADPARDQFLARVDAHAQEIITRAGGVIHQDPDVRAYVRFCLFTYTNDRWQLHTLLSPQQAAVYRTENSRRE